MMCGARSKAETYTCFKEASPHSVLLSVVSIVPPAPRAERPDRPPKTHSPPHPLPSPSSSPSLTIVCAAGPPRRAVRPRTHAHQHKPTNLVNSIPTHAAYLPANPSNRTSPIYSPKQLGHPGRASRDVCAAPDSLTSGRRVSRLAASGIKQPCPQIDFSQVFILMNLRRRTPDRKPGFTAGCVKHS